MKRAFAIMSALAVALSLTIGVRAHPMDVRTGEFEWTSVGFIVRVSDDHGAASHDDTTEHERAHAAPGAVNWSAAFDVRDEHGETVAPDSIRHDAANASMTLSFQSTTEAVTIALDPAAIGDSPLRQVQLWERGESDDVGRAYRLTRRGNVEVVRRDQDASGASKEFQTPSLIIDTSSSTWRGVLVTPLQFIPQREGAERDNAPAIDQSWVVANRDRVAAWVRDHLQAVSHDDALAPSITRIDVIKPDGRVADDAADWPLNAHITRVRIDFQFQAEPDEVNAIAWTGFSPRAQRLRCDVIRDGAIVRRSLLNAYSNVLPISRDR